jgi:ankyrin repeat protein
MACISRSLDIMTLLLENGVPIVNSTDGSTILHYAAKYGSLEICKMILQHKLFSIDAKGPLGTTCLHAICGAEGNFEMKVLQFLLNYGANYKCRDELGRTPIFEAARTGNKECLELLVNIGNA